MSAIKPLLDQLRATISAISKGTLREARANGAMVNATSMRRFRIKDVVANGDCFFASMLVLLGKLDKDRFSANASRADMLRRAVADFFRQLKAQHFETYVRVYQHIRALEYTLTQRHHAAAHNRNMAKVRAHAVGQPAAAWEYDPELDDLNQELGRKEHVNLGLACVIAVCCGTLPFIYVMPLGKDETLGWPILLEPATELRGVANELGIDVEELIPGEIMFRRLDEKGHPGHYVVLEQMGNSVAAGPSSKRQRTA